MLLKQYRQSDVLWESDGPPMCFAQTSGNDIFYRNPRNVNENLFVDVSSPSSSNFSTVEDLGPPEEAAKRTLNQYLEELMSTRIGVRRTGEILSADKRTGPDGKEYYDIQVDSVSRSFISVVILRSHDIFSA
jgi:hypothetical protein